MRKHTGELIFAAALTALGVAMAVSAGGYRIFGAGGRIAPGFTPLLAGVALAGFAAWALVETVVKIRRTPAADSQPSPTQPDDVAEGATAAPASGSAAPTERRAALVFAMMLGAILLSVVIGFLASFGVLILALLWFVEREKPWLAILISVTSVLTAWLVFVQLLQIPLPDGMIGLLGRV
ncbi:MAG: hypothetical protein GEV07_10200 [Streptosporangiales bacterium]|nr:hypothetical protein [Streptosporangiales bacterium]